VERWPALIHGLVGSGRWREIGEGARKMAESESWEVQAGRFRRHFENMLESGE